MNETRIFQIGSFCFSLTYPPQITPPPNFMIFETPGGCPEFFYTISVKDCLPEPVGTLVAARVDIRIFRNGELENRLIGVKGRKDYYAYYQENTDSSAEIVFLNNAVEELHFDPVFSSLLALERRMEKKNALILHCAYMKYQGEAILFSAPSETGKTTQANLWEKYRGSTTINGDKALLQCIEGRWTAQGWPVCGTSEICHNLATPIRAIVMLSQGEEDQIRRLSPVEAFSQIYSQITVNTWNRNFVQHNMNLIETLITQIPVWLLSCTISENAVRCLEDALDRESTFHLSGR